MVSTLVVSTLTSGCLRGTRCIRRWAISAPRRGSDLNDLDVIIVMKPIIKVIIVMKPIIKAIHALE